MDANDDEMAMFEAELAALEEGGDEEAAAGAEKAAAAAPSPAPEAKPEQAADPSVDSGIGKVRRRPPDGEAGPNAAAGGVANGAGGGAGLAPAAKPAGLDGIAGRDPNSWTSGACADTKAARLRNPKKRTVRVAGGQTWVDPTLDEWPENDFRLFITDLAHDTTTEMVQAAFVHYPSFAKCKVTMDKHTGRSRGFAHVSFLDPQDCMRAFKEQQGKYVGSRAGSRPMRIKISTWQKRAMAVDKHGRKKQRQLVATQRDVDRSGKLRYTRNSFK